MESPTIRLLRFADLKEAGIVSNWPQLGRLIKNSNFPPGYLLGPQTRVWDAPDIEAWLQHRRDASARASQAPETSDGAHP